jgi:hypothetical protein
MLSLFKKSYCKNFFNFAHLKYGKILVLKKIFPSFQFLRSGYHKVRQSRLVKILLLIILIKFLVFYGFLKGFLYPRFLKPHYESNEHRSEEVMKDLLENHSNKTYNYNGKH